MHTRSTIAKMSPWPDEGGDLIRQLVVGDAKALSVAELELHAGLVDAVCHVWLLEVRMPLMTMSGASLGG